MKAQPFVLRFLCPQIALWSAYSSSYVGYSRSHTGGCRNWDSSYVRVQLIHQLFYSARTIERAPAYRLMFPRSRLSAMLFMPHALMICFSPPISQRTALGLCDPVWPQTTLGLPTPRFRAPLPLLGSHNYYQPPFLPSSLCCVLFLKHFA